MKPQLSQKYGVGLGAGLTKRKGLRPIAVPFRDHVQDEKVSLPHCSTNASQGTL